MPQYAELHCLSNFSFLKGASQPAELVQRAYELGYTALAITDECSLAGVVRALDASREYPVQLIIGSEFRLGELHLVLLAIDHTGYSQLCQLITTGRRAAPKGEYQLQSRHFERGLDHCLALWIPAGQPDINQAYWLKQHFSKRSWIGVSLHHGPDDAARLEAVQHISRQADLPVTACGSVLMHVRKRRALQDTLTAIRLNTPVSRAGLALQANGERHLRSRKTLAGLYPTELLEESVRIARRCRFSLDCLNYQYPHEVVPPGKTAPAHLRELTEAGALLRWPDGVPARIRGKIEHELELIREMNYESYFLTINDIVEYARSQGILCQGRGSAANSVVCYCLGITAADPDRVGLLFERFISKERDEPPDIDVDFEHQRREEVIQYIYKKYGRDRAALAATVITYRRKSAIRDVGKALGLDPDYLQQIAGNVAWWDDYRTFVRQLKQSGFNDGSLVARHFFYLVTEISGFPRHLSQHVGGFVIAEQPLNTLVPVENASMADRTVIQWDKDDLETLGLMKVDCLALGMLSALQRSFALIQDFYGHTVDLYTIPEGDTAVYRMIQEADTIGVFQIESRAQQSMLPRLKPACYYDLVIEIAIVRPGPIQGNMVHPYLRRRTGKEAVTYPSKALEAVLSRTLGVPIFQEQAMKIAMVAAGFSAGEADRLRRAMAAWKRRGGLEPFRVKLIGGMLERGYSAEFAEQIFSQIQGFGSYGFPESHSASFAILAYASCWLKHHYPAAFTCALLNSQPMGFYGPSQLIQDAQRHGVEVWPTDVRYSRSDSHLVHNSQAATKPESAVIRMGLRMIKGLGTAAAARIVAARRQAPFRNVQDLLERAAVNRRDLQKLADSGALRGIAGHRHRANWQTLAARADPQLLRGSQPDEARVRLRPPGAGENLWADYSATGVSLKQHPMELVRQYLPRKPVCARSFNGLKHSSSVYTAGLVTNRQRPGTASGVVFVTLEDETGLINVVVWPKLAEAQRKVLLGSGLMGVSGHVETEGNVYHLIAHQLFDHSELIQALQTRSRDFH